MSTEEAKKKADETHEEWKKRANKLGDAYFKACRRIASALNRLSRSREKKN